MLKGAIFDMDGLLFDTERLYRDMWVLLAEESDQQPDPAFPKAVCGSSGDHMLEIIHHYYPSVDAAWFRDECIRRVAAQLEKDVPIKKGTVEILKSLKIRGLRLAVASSSPLRSIEHNLEMTGTKNYFDAVVSGLQVKHGKPAPDIFCLAASKLELLPAECYVFEDSANGIRAGAAAGCTTIMIPDLTEPTEDLRSLCAGVYDSLLEALGAL